jgi:hypothetical protein
MSNFLSQPVQYAKPPSDSNFELLSKVAMMQQQKYDVNHQQVQQTLDAFGAIKTLRAEDDEYIASKLNSITTQANTMGGNLANQSMSNQFISKIKGAAQDPAILNAMEQTRKMQNYQKELATLKEKKPELYNDLNNSFALTQAGYSDYMEGKTDKLGTLSYNPYVDVTKSALEKVKQLKDIRGEQTLDVPVLDSSGNPTGRTNKRTIKGLTEDEIFKYIPNILTSEEQSQLVIDGWGKYRGNMAGAQQQFKKYISDKESLIDTNIAAAKAVEANTANSEDKRKEAREVVKSLTGQKEQLKADMSSMNINSAVQLGGFLHTKEFQESIASMAQAKWSEEFGVDEYYFDKANLDLAYEKNEREKLEAEQKAGTAVGVVNPNAVSISEREGELPETLDPIGQLKGDYNGVYNDMISSTRAAYNSDKTTPEMKTQFKAEMNRMGYDENGVVIDVAKASKTSKASAFKLAFTESKMQYMHGDIAKKLSGLELKRSALANEFGGTTRESLAEGFKGNEDKYITSLKDEMETAIVDAQSDTFEDFAEEDMKKHKKAEAFVNANGGWGKLKSNLAKNPQKLEEFSNVLDELTKRTARTISTNIFRQSLKEDTKGLANEKLVQKVKDKKNIYFNTAEIATIGDKAAREKLINMLPQDANTALFEADKPISFYKNVDGSLTIMQNRGVTTGAKSVANAPAKIIVDKEDATYQELMKYVDLTEKGRGLAADRTKIELKPQRPAQFIDDNKGTVLGRIDEQMKNLPPTTIKGLFTDFPANYLTKARTLEKYKRTLKGTVPEEQIEAFVDDLSSNMSSFKIKLMPFDNTWAIQLKNPEGDVLNEGSTGMTYLEDDVANLVENYPQTLIGDWVLRRLLKNPKEINTLLK